MPCGCGCGGSLTSWSCCGCGRSSVSGHAMVGHRFHGFVGHVVGFVWWVIGIMGVVGHRFRVMPWLWVYAVGFMGHAVVGHRFVLWWVISLCHGVRGSCHDGSRLSFSFVVMC